MPPKGLEELYDVYVYVFWKQVSDVVPVACRAAADAGIPSVCITNFRFSRLTPFLLHIFFVIYYLAEIRVCIMIQQMFR